MADLPDDVFEHLPDVRRADVRHVRLGERLGTPTLELRPAAHRVLELRTVRLDPERRAGGRPDGRTEQHVVREDEVGGKECAQCGGVRLDVGVELVRAEVLQQLRLESGVPVKDERGQAPARQLRRDDGRAAEIELLWLTLLADDDHFVTGATPFAGERTRVDVRSRAAEQVAVPEQDPHRAGALTSGGSRGRAATRPQGSRCAR